MDSPSDELQTAIFEALVTDAGVTTLVADRVYDRRPQEGDYPCITFGESQVLPEDMDCIAGREEIVDLHVWARDGGKLWPARAICDAVKGALHHAALSLVSHALAQIEVETMRVFLDQDDLTAHGVVTVRALVEER